MEILDIVDDNGKKTKTLAKTEAKNAIGASLTNTNSNPCKIVPATANSGSLKFQFI